MFEGLLKLKYGKKSVYKLIKHDNTVYTAVSNPTEDSSYKVKSLF